MLEAQDQIGRDGSNQAEYNEGDSVLLPTHFFGRINAGHPENESLNGSKKEIEPSHLTLEYAGHIAAERLDESDDDENKDPIL